MNHQTDRLLAFFEAHPNEDIPMPVLNGVCAGPGGVFAASWTRRLHEARKRAQSQGASIAKVRDEWVVTENGRARQTAYRYLPPQTC